MSLKTWKTRWNISIHTSRSSLRTSGCHEARENAVNTIKARLLSIKAGPVLLYPQFDRFIPDTELRQPVHPGVIVDFPILALRRIVHPVGGRREKPQHDLLAAFERLFIERRHQVDGFHTGFFVEPFAVDLKYRIEVLFERDFAEYRAPL